MSRTRGATPTPCRRPRRDLISAVTRIELAFVVEGRKGEPGRADLEGLLAVGGFEVVAVTPDQAARAIDAFRRFGRGRHPASLNIGDCFSYALAAAMEEELLFKGDDFAQSGHSLGAAGRFAR